jgi:hypothetical protein
VVNGRIPIMQDSTGHLHQYGIDLYYYALNTCDVTIFPLASPLCTRSASFHLIFVIFYGVKEKITFGRGGQKKRGVVT